MRRWGRDGKRGQIDALQARVAELEGVQARVGELEARLDHERLYPAEWANRRVRDRFGNSVVAGPFAGLEYPEWGFHAVNLYAPKLLGTYEREIHGRLEEAIAAEPPVVINIGAADGYYAVGLALRLPQARIVAFDGDESKLEQLRGIAEHNGVAARVEAVAALCDHAALREHLDPGALVVCDCEGCEGALLDPSEVPELARAAVIVEVHDHIAPGTEERLRSAFASTHEIHAVPTAPRYVDDHPELAFMPLVTQQLAVSEFRGTPMSWLAMVEKKP